MQRLRTKETYKTTRGAHHSNLMGGPQHFQLLRHWPGLSVLLAGHLNCIRLFRGTAPVQEVVVEAYLEKIYT